MSCLRPDGTLHELDSRRPTWVAAAALSAAVLLSCNGADPPPAFAPAPDPALNVVDIEQRAPKVYSCKGVGCHDDREPNPEPRPLEEFHLGKQLNHGSDLVWCTWCHAKNVETLRLLDGTEVTFNEGYRLCGQCHGDRYRDWKMGVHGKQVGSWSGKKERWSCPSCHNPHRPKNPGMKALPPPLPLRGGSDGHGKGGGGSEH